MKKSELIVTLQYIERCLRNGLSDRDFVVAARNEVLRLLMCLEHECSTEWSVKNEKNEKQKTERKNRNATPAHPRASKGENPKARRERASKRK